MSQDPVPAIAAAIVAAGRGERAGQTGEGPKQYRRIGGEPILRRTLRAFLCRPSIGPVAIAIHPDDNKLAQEAIGDLGDGRVRIVHGGASRQASVLAALEALADCPPDHVLIHDGVRPFLDGELIDRIIAGLASGCGVLPAMAVADTLKRADGNGKVVATEPREGMFMAQTPQAFPFAAILAAHRRAAHEKPHHFTDDSMLAEWAGIAVQIVEGSSDNTKLTWARDLEAAERRLAGAQQANYPDVRTATGYDVHAFGEGDHVMLCGVRIPHGRKLTGHSDADVGLHALTDALLGTCGQGDIGTHFPPSDPQWQGAPSRIFLEKAVEEVRQRRGRIANVDVTFIAESPKIGPHRAAMTDQIAEILSISTKRISIKATTNERLGFIGREEGIAAIATATVVYPGGIAE